jgi:uncharacterized glyoxalase superfamily protein PhnB
MTKSPAKSASKPNGNVKVKPIPDGMHSMTPHLVCAGAKSAIEFYKKAFGAVELNRMEVDGGIIMNAALQIAGSSVMLVDENKQWGMLGPKALNGTPVTIHLYVEDVDAAMAKAEKAGATIKMPAQDMFWGDRYGVVEDPFGHKWSIARHLRDMSMDEIREAMMKAGPSGECG